MSIYNLVQNSEDFATISTSGYFQFHNEVSFYGSSMLERGRNGEEEEGRAGWAGGEGDRERREKKKKRGGRGKQGLFNLI